jgi:hypothetical protein
MAMRRFPHFIHTFKKLFINQAYNWQFWKFFQNYHEFFMNFFQTTWKNWACQYFQNYHELFPKLLGNFNLLNISE